MTRREPRHLVGYHRSPKSLRLEAKRQREAKQAAELERFRAIVATSEAMAARDRREEDTRRRQALAAAEASAKAAEEAVLEFHRLRAHVWFGEGNHES